jgi:serine/threonine-protein kinase
MAQKDNSEAEALFREAIAMFSRTLPPDSLNEGIARIKLGRALRRQDRFSEAVPESLRGYRVVSKQASPSAPWLRFAREDLVADYTALHQPEKNREFLVEPSTVAASQIRAR